MTSFFIAKFKGNMIDKYDKDLTHEFLFKLATDKELKPDEDAPITLEQSKKWCDHFKVSITAIDKKGNQFFHYKPDIVSKKIKGGFKLYILIEQNHVWGIDPQHYKKIDQKQLLEEVVNDFKKANKID